MSVNIPVVNLGYLNVQGLEIVVTGDEGATVAAGQARDSTNVNDIVLSSTATLDMATNGINGLDTGSIGASKVYGLYLVGDSTGVNDTGVVASLDQSSPLLPVGYDMFRLIGYLTSDGSSDFLIGEFSGSSNQRTWTYDVPIATAVTAGASGTYAAVTLTAFVPAVENTPVLIESDWTANGAADTLALQSFGATGDTVKYIAPVAGGTAHTLVRDYVNAQLDSGVPKINYKVSAAAVALNVAGYQYTI